MRLNQYFTVFFNPNFNDKFIYIGSSQGAYLSHILANSYQKLFF